MKEPHGGRLIERVMEGGRRQSLEASIDGPTVTLDTETYQDAINIVSGRYSPLEGFMTQSDFLKVVEDMTLEDGTAASLAIATPSSKRSTPGLAYFLRQISPAGIGTVMAYYSQGANAFTWSWFGKQGILSVQQSLDADLQALKVVDSNGAEGVLQITTGSADEGTYWGEIGLSYLAVRTAADEPLRALEVEDSNGDPGILQLTLSKQPEGYEVATEERTGYWAEAGLSPDPGLPPV